MALELSTSNIADCANEVQIALDSIEQSLPAAMHKKVLTNLSCIRAMFLSLESHMLSLAEGRGDAQEVLRDGAKITQANFSKIEMILQYVQAPSNSPQEDFPRLIHFSEFLESVFGEGAARRTSDARIAILPGKDGGQKVFKMSLNAVESTQSSTIIISSSSNEGPGDVDPNAGKKGAAPVQRRSFCLTKNEKQTMKQSINVISSSADGVFELRCSAVSACVAEVQEALNYAKNLPAAVNEKPVTNLSSMKNFFSKLEKRLSETDPVNTLNIYAFLYNACEISQGNHVGIIKAIIYVKCYIAKSRPAARNLSLVLDYFVTFLELVFGPERFEPSNARVRQRSNNDKYILLILKDPSLELPKPPVTTIDEGDKHKTATFPDDEATEKPNKKTFEKKESMRTAPEKLRNSFELRRSNVAGCLEEIQQILKFLEQNPAEKFRSNLMGLNRMFEKLEKYMSIFDGEIAKDTESQKRHSRGKLGGYKGEYILDVFHKGTGITHQAAKPMINFIGRVRAFAKMKLIDDEHFVAFSETSEMGHFVMCLRCVFGDGSHEETLRNARMFCVFVGNSVRSKDPVISYTPLHNRSISLMFFDDCASNIFEGDGDEDDNNDILSHALSSHI